MDPSPLLVVLLVLALGIIGWLVVRALRGGVRLELVIGGMDARKLPAFTREVHEEAGRYLQANYSGDPGHLPHALQGLMNMVRDRARHEGIAVDDTILKKLVEISVIKQRIAKPDQVRTALERAA